MRNSPEPSFPPIALFAEAVIEESPPRVHRDAAQFIP